MNRVHIKFVTLGPLLKSSRRFTFRHLSVTTNVFVHFADEKDKAMCSKDMPMGRQVFRFRLILLVDPFD